MALQLNLEKSAQKLVLSLEKSGITPPKLDVAFGLDVSGSFEDEHLKGVTNQLLTRLLPWGLVFDPDRKIDMLTFSNGAEHVQYVGCVTEHNHQNFVQQYVVGKVKGWNGGTDYSYLLERMLQNFGWTETIKKASLFGRLMGHKDQVVQGDRRRSLAIVVTDGDNLDKQRCMEVLRQSEARGDQVYFLFIGISNQGSRFPFLERIGEAFGNTGFVAISNLRQFVELDDDALNHALLNEELLAWLASR